MTGPNGCAGSILKVDLSGEAVTRIPTEDYFDRFLGGRGVAAKIYWDEIRPETEAHDPENKLIFMTGPVTGTTGFAGSRWQVCGKSAIHNRFSYANLGGAWGALLKRAGYDGLIVSGKAGGPVTLWIHDGKVEVRRADHLWGKGAITCQELLANELGRSARVAAIGPAGENAVPFATILADQDASGAGGLAAVMGSKRLKAVAVAGKKRIGVADREEVRALKEEVIRVTEPLRLPVGADMPGFILPMEKIRNQACYDCIRGGICIRKTYRSGGGRKGKFMCHAGNFYMPFAQEYYGECNDVPFEVNRICDDHGVDSHAIDTMTMWLAGCYKAGILTDEQTGLPLSRLGSLEFMETLVRDVSNRNGFGDVLAKGTREAAEIVGPEARGLITDYMTRRGELDVYGARQYITTGLFWATEPRLPIQLLHEVCVPVYRWLSWVVGLDSHGPTSDHLRAIAKRYWGSELAVDFSTYEGKALAAVKIQDRSYAKECLILCDFMWPMPYSRIAEDRIGDPTLESRLCAAVTGRGIDEQGLYRIGEKALNLQRAIMVREGGRGRRDDVLEDFDYEIPLKADIWNEENVVPGKDGAPFPRKGLVVDRNAFEKVKDEFYEARGWDVTTGLQTRQKLEEVDLPDVADLLERDGLLAGE